MSKETIMFEYNQMYDQFLSESKNILSVAEESLSNQMQDILGDKFGTLRLSMQRKRLYVMYEQQLGCDPKEDHLISRDVYPIFGAFVDNCQNDLKKALFAVLKSNFYESITSMFQKELNIRKQLDEDNTELRQNLFKAKKLYEKLMEIITSGNREANLGELKKEADSIYKKPEKAQPPSSAMKQKIQIEALTEQIRLNKQVLVTSKIEASKYKAENVTLNEKVGVLELQLQYLQQDIQDMNKRHAEELKAVETKFQQQPIAPNRDAEFQERIVDLQDDLRRRDEEILKFYDQVADLQRQLKEVQQKSKDDTFHFNELLEKKQDLTERLQLQIDMATKNDQQQLSQMITKLQSENKSLTEKAAKQELEIQSNLENIKVLETEKVETAADLEATREISSKAMERLQVPKSDKAIMTAPMLQQSTPVQRAEEPITKPLSKETINIPTIPPKQRPDKRLAQLEDEANQLKSHIKKLVQVVEKTFGVDISAAKEGPGGLTDYERAVGGLKEQIDTDMALYAAEIKRLSELRGELKKVQVADKTVQANSFDQELLKSDLKESQLHTSPNNQSQAATSHSGNTQLSQITKLPGIDKRKEITYSMLAQEYSVGEIQQRQQIESAFERLYTDALISKRKLDALRLKYQKPLKILPGATMTITYEDELFQHIKRVCVEFFEANSLRLPIMIEERIANAQISSVAQQRRGQEKSSFESKAGNSLISRPRSMIAFEQQKGGK